MRELNIDVVMMENSTSVENEVINGHGLESVCTFLYDN